MLCLICLYLLCVLVLRAENLPYDIITHCITAESVFNYLHIFQIFKTRSLEFTIKSYKKAGKQEQKCILLHSFWSVDVFSLRLLSFQILQCGWLFGAKPEWKVLLFPLSLKTLINSYMVVNYSSVPNYNMTKWRGSQRLLIRIVTNFWWFSHFAVKHSMISYTIESRQCFGVDVWF